MFKNLKAIIIVLGFFSVAFLVFIVLNPKEDASINSFESLRQEAVKEGRKEDLPVEEKGHIEIEEVGEKKTLSPTKQVYQTFNNCGPATISMILSYYGVQKSQEEIGRELRPYQHPKGDNDDKTIFPEEVAAYIKDTGLVSYHRVSGDIDLLKLFISNDFPVVVKQWLHKGEDIGHFRIVRGYNEKEKVLITDDSYDGPNRKIPYGEFNELWQPFNYTYTIVTPLEKKGVVEEILADSKSESLAFEMAVARALEELEVDPNSIYSLFNLSTSYSHLGDYKKSVEYFEEVEKELPRRMLWYQIEPILAYKELGDYDRVFEITTNILNNGNLAFSELYQIRGEIYLEQGEKELAKAQFERALRYNENYLPARESMGRL